MSYDKLLNSLSPERKEFVLKIYNELADNTATDTSSGENMRKYFLQLVEKMKKFLKKKKNFVEKSLFIYMN